MAHTVKQLARISGVSIRTLHFYDEIGLLKPAYLGDNRYRFYEKEQLLTLQQILFYRELGFELKTIQTIINRPDFDKITALKTHKQVLLKKSTHTRKLIKTIDKTVVELMGGKKLKANELFVGFDKEKQAEYERYLINQFGENAKKNLAETKRNIKKWTEEDWERSGKEWDEICKEMANLAKKHLKANSPEVQKVIRRHHEWLKQFWTPNKKSYTGMGMGYTGFEWKKAFEAYDSNHPKLAQFFANAIEIFAEKELS